MTITSDTSPVEELADSDSALRHSPSEPPGRFAGDPATAPAAPGAGPDWADTPANPIQRGQTKAGGADPAHPHLFHLADSPAQVFDGGGLQGASGDNWEILTKQNGAVYLIRLEPGGVREPHWHPSAWELNFVISGKVRWIFVGPDSTGERFEGGKGDLIFAPQGHFHLFENASETEDLVVLAVFNSDAAEGKDDIGIVESLSAMPADSLAAVFGTSPDVFKAIPRRSSRVVIARKPEAGR